MRSTAFWVDVAERAGKTFAQALVPLLAADGANLLSVDWPTSLGLAATAAALSVLTSIGSGVVPIGPAGSPSLVATGRHARAE